MQSTRDDLTGKRFGRLQVIRYSHTKDKHAYWICICDCGTECVKLGKRLKNGTTTSCGCWRYLAKRKHGLTGTPIYIVWNAMIGRCYDPTDRDYPSYGGRGIEVCDRWRGDDGPTNLLADMDEPIKGYTLERIANNGNYEPENCKWETRKGQARNRRNNRILTFDGRDQCLTAWAEEVGISPGVITTRLNLGWSIEHALTTPVDQRFSH